MAWRRLILLRRGVRPRADGRAQCRRPRAAASAEHLEVLLGDRRTVLDRVDPDADQVADDLGVGVRRDPGAAGVGELDHGLDQPGRVGLLHRAVPDRAVRADRREVGDELHPGRAVVQLGADRASRSSGSTGSCIRGK